MAKILGLDLGSNSLGWAVVDTDLEIIIASGVKIFSEGVENLGEGEREKSRNAARNEYRGKRKQIFRRRLRKQQLMNLMQEVGLAPLESDEIDTWMKTNPYTLRMRALHEALTPLELGRIFYHLAQRRGFPTNLRGGGESDSKTLFEGKDGKTGINATKEQIGSATLGSYLAQIYPTEGVSYEGIKERIRNRYTTRSMYTEEFERIWECQQKYMPQLLSNELKQRIGGRKADGYEEDGILFYQRKLKSQKHRVGKCSFESGKTKCPISHPDFERFRLLQSINTIVVNGKKLSEAQRTTLATNFRSRDSSIKLSNIRSWLKMKDQSYRFNYTDDDSFAGSHTLSKLLNKNSGFADRWDGLSQKDRDDIWHALYYFDDKRRLVKWLCDKYALTVEQAEYLTNVQLKQGYASLSLKAIRNILPFLEMGYMYSDAALLGGVRNAFGVNWDELLQVERDTIVDTILDISSRKITGGMLAEIRSYLDGQYGSKVNLNKLYHHSDKRDSGALANKLPTGRQADTEIMKIRNPVVIKGLFELRKVVNKVITDFGKPDQVNIEMSRDLKSTKKQRFNTRREQIELRTKNEKAREELEKLFGPDKRVSYEDIQKYNLWIECEKRCPYTDEQIGMEDLFNGRFEIEHIVPYSRSLDDSFMNKTLCKREINKEKGDRTPYEYFSQKYGEPKWDEVKFRMLQVFTTSKQFPHRYKKFKRFTRKSVDELAGFISRQLNDTRYVSVEARSYMSKILPYEKVNVSAGRVTAHLRHLWGLNDLLGDSNNEKNRDDHRHHAIDAAVVALTSVSTLQKMARASGSGERMSSVHIDPPWLNFRGHVQDAVLNIVVEHSRSNRVLSKRKVRSLKGKHIYVNQGVAVRGQLHKETVYGKRQDPETGDSNFRIRKSIAELKDSKQVMKVANRTIRDLIKNRLEQIGVDTSKPYQIPKNAFFDTEGKPLLFLPNRKGGASVPINKVRMREELGNAVQLKGAKLNQWVNPRNNHHVMIYEKENGEWAEQVVTLWTAAEREKEGLSAYLLPPDGNRIIEILEVGMLFVIGLKPEEVPDSDPAVVANHTYRVQKLSSMYYTFRVHNASTLKYAEEELRIQSLKKWKELIPIRIDRV